MTEKDTEEIVLETVREEAQHNLELLKQDEDADEEMVKLAEEEVEKYAEEEEDE